VPDTEPFSWSDIQPFPLESALNRVAYAEQEAYYLGFDGPSVTSATNADW
jgi:hypothetical protein